MDLLFENWRKYLNEGDVVDLSSHSEYKKHPVEISVFADDYRALLRWAMEQASGGEVLTADDVFGQANKGRERPWLHDNQTRDVELVDRIIARSMEFAAKRKPKTKKNILTRIRNFFKEGDR